MDMLEGVGRRSGSEQILNLGIHSLNGYERNGLFRNNGDGTFTDVGWLHGVDREEDGRGVAIFDFDRDGRLDIAQHGGEATLDLVRACRDAVESRRRRRAHPSARWGRVADT
jgi:hypothetical protein